MFLLSGRIPYGTSSVCRASWRPDRLLANSIDPVNYRRPARRTDTHAGADPMASWTQPPAVLWPDADNDHDAYVVGRNGYIAALRRRRTINKPPAVHPLSFTGTGAITSTMTRRRHDSGTAECGCDNGLGAPAPYTITHRHGRRMRAPTQGHWTDQGRLGPAGPRFTGCFPIPTRGQAGTHCRRRPIRQIRRPDR